MKTRSKKTLLSTTAIMMATLLMSSQANAQTIPSNSWNYDTVRGGVISKNTSVAGITDITVTGGNGFVEGNADIYTGHSVNVIGDSGATFAYRDNRANIQSALNGDLNSNMQIVIIDKDGLFFGTGFNADVQGIVASTGDIAVGDIMNNGSLLIENIDQGGDITLNGSITVANAGLAAFVAPNVANNSMIHAKFGRVQMGAAQSVTVDLYGDGLIELALSGELADALIENNGTILAEGSFVQMSAMAAKNTVDNIVNNDGVIIAASATVAGGKIILSGGHHGTVRNTGTINTSNGGEVNISGERFVQETLYSSMETNGSNVNINTSGDVEIIDSYIDAGGGDIDINNGGIFSSNNDDILTTEGTGTISVRQNAGGSIQNAIDAIDNSGAGTNTVKVGAGTYSESVNADLENLILEGNNAGTAGYDARAPETIIAPNSPGIYVTADNVTVNGFTITGADNGIFVDNANNALVADNIITSSVTGIRFEGSNEARILDNSITNTTGGNIAGDGILIRVGKNILVDGNHISDNGDEGIFASGNVDGLVISNNTIDNTGLLTNISGNGIELFATYGDIQILNNTITNADYYGVWIKSPYGSGRFIIEGNTIDTTKHAGIRVDKNAISISNNTINNTGDDGIEIFNSEDVSVQDNFVGTLGGADNIGNEGIDVNNSPYANISGNTVMNTVSNGVSINPSPDSIIIGNVISNVGGNAIYVLNSDYAEIIDNDIHDARRDGIHIDNGKYAYIVENHIHRVGDDGIDVNSNRGVDIYENTIRRTGLDRSDGNGIEVSNSLNAYIIDNNIKRAGDDGIDIEYSRHANITDNYIRFSDDDGIDVEHSNGTNIRRNIVLDSGDDGIELVHSSHVDIINNKIRRSEENGIQINGWHDIKVKRNKINNSGENGIYARNVDDLFLVNNKIRNSYENGIYVAGASNGYVRFQGNRLTDNAHLSGSAGARFESGDIDMSNLDNPNIIINTTGLPAIGLQFDKSESFNRDSFASSDLHIIDETLGSTIFEGFEPLGSFYVRFEDGSILDAANNPIVIDGTNASFDGIIPSNTGNILSAPNLNFIEQRLYDADDAPVNGRGQIFVGAVAEDTQSINNFQDFFPPLRFPGRKPDGVLLTINGFPLTGWLSALDFNNIAPAAGENGDPEELAKITPQAGGGNGSQTVTCIGDALNSLSSGSVTYSFGGSFENSVAGEAGCSTTDL